MSTSIADNQNIPNDQWITASVSGTGNITGDRSQTLIANSSWSQVNGGVPFGTSFGSLVAVRNYRGGTSEIWNGYGGFASTYCGTESQSWNDPSIASYDARNLNGTRFTPHNPPGVPAPYPFSTTSKTFVMPPSLVEDAEAAAVEKGEESAIGRFLWSLVPGSSLVDAYRDYQKGSYVSAALNGLFGLADLATVGSLVKVRSGLKLLVGFMKVRVKDAVADEAANQAGVAVAERLGPEAGFVTQIIVSATLSKSVSQQNKTQLGFAADGAKNSARNTTLQKSTFQIPKVWRSGGGVQGTFSDGMHTFRIDTRNLSLGERFHIHIYDPRGREIAVIQGSGTNGVWRYSHRNRILRKPSEVSSGLRTDIRRLIQNALRNIE